MTKNSAQKRAAREYMAAHGVPYTTALRRIKRLNVGDRVREIPGEGDVKKMPIGRVEEITLDHNDVNELYDIKYPDGQVSILMERSELEAVE